MPTSLTFSEHLDALETSGGRLADLALEAGLDVAVPTCPAWTTDALVAHQAMVHRWAAAHVRGDDPDVIPSQTEIRTTVDDLVGYYRDGHGALLATFHDAAPDLEAMTFLKDAPAPRDFWARRQAHETTIHMIDALAAVLGRLPTAERSRHRPGAGHRRNRRAVARLLHPWAFEAVRRRRVHDRGVPERQRAALDRPGRRTADRRPGRPGRRIDEVANAVISGHERRAVPRPVEPRRRGRGERTAPTSSIGGGPRSASRWS